MQEKETLNTLNCDSFETHQTYVRFHAWIWIFVFAFVIFRDSYFVFQNVPGWFISVYFHLCYSLPMWDLVMVGFVNNFIIRYFSLSCCPCVPCVLIKFSVFMFGFPVSCFIVAVTCCTVLPSLSYHWINFCSSTIVHYFMWFSCV